MPDGQRAVAGPSPVDACAKNKIPTLPGSSLPSGSDSYFRLPPSWTGIFANFATSSALPAYSTEISSGADQVFAISAAKHEPLLSCSVAGGTLKKSQPTVLSAALAASHGLPHTLPEHPWSAGQVRMTLPL